MKKVLLPLATALCALTISEASAQTTTTRVQLHEVFTSSTCGPCRPGNATYDAVIAGKTAGQYVSVKFQQNFPSTGDPYGTIETVNRRNFYAINSIPRMEIDGGWDKNAQSFTSAIYDQYGAVPATYKLIGNYTVTGNVVTTHSIFTPLTAGNSPKLYVAILESVTTKNVRTNGETVFHNVVKKMVPNENGTDVSSTAVGTEKILTQSYTFPAPNRLPANYGDKINLSTENSVENFKNLVVVAWIQGANKEVYQAANFSNSPVGVGNISAPFAEYKVFPVPATNQLNISMDMNKADVVSVNLVNLAGQVVATQTTNMAAGNNKVSINTSSLAAGSYTLILMDSESNVQAQGVSIVH